VSENIKKNLSGIEIGRIYSSGPVSLPDAGEYPYTRGIHPDMHRHRPWTMRQYAGFSTAEESNKRYKYLLAQGTTGLSVAFDLPTQIGYDSDHPLADGEVGKVGVAIDSIHDMETLFMDIDLQKISTSMTINATAYILLALYIAVAKKQGADPKLISGTIQNDILKEYAARGTYIYPPQPSMKIITDIFAFCSAELPLWNTISISGYHIREAGSTAAQELAFTLANGKAYLQAAINKGLDINVFGKRLSFFFNAHNDFFEEVAKFRAARKMWAAITHSLGATDPKAQMLRFHTQTGGSTLTAQQPLNNISRVTIQAMAAVMGGTQSLHTNGYDEALSLPTAEAAKTALRTQQIIAFESGITAAADPLGGSYFVEYLTTEIEKQAQNYLDKIDEMGGAVRAIENHYIQNEIARSSYEYHKMIEASEAVIVGLNKFTQEESLNIPIFKINDEIRKLQSAKIASLKAARHTQLVEKALYNLTAKTRADENIMPAVIQAVEAEATLGEIADTLRAIYGEYHG